MQLIFGKYEIQHRLAIGGMGEVFYAVQKGVPGFERPVILKSLLPDLAVQDGFIEQFLDEARVAATLNHPNVVSIYEVGQWSGTYYLAMEYIRGRNLAQLVRRAIEQQVEVPQLVAARIVRDAALGLDHAHRATDSEGRVLNIVHRDISPQNVMVRDDGLTKVVDFGIARASNRATRTATGAIKGKLAYMAPEQILDQNVGPAVDQFALGIVLWELLTQRRLFKAERDLDLVRMVLEQPILLPSSGARAVSPALEVVVMRMLERELSRRFPSCAEVAQALDAVLVAESEGDSSSKDFMRRLGTEDLQVTRRPSAGSDKNFVISLKEAPAAGPERAALTVEQAPPVLDASVSVHLTGLTGSLKAGRQRRMLVGGLVALVLVAVGSVVAKQILPDVEAKTPPSKDSSLPPVPPVPGPNVQAELSLDAALDRSDAAPPPRVVPARLVITSMPPALVRLDGRPLGQTPQEVEVSPGEPHYLQAEKAGFKRVEDTLTVAPGEVRPVTLKLSRIIVDPPPPPLPSVAPQPLEPGFLSVETTPWTKVTVDGDPVGSTPLFKKRLTAGRHEVSFVNEGAGVSERRFVTIESGETQKLVLSFQR
jgi:serine/threonine protein kinase